MITLSASDSQIVLYAKGHFGNDRTNAVEDMRILVANRAGSQPKYISDRNIVTVVTTLLEELNLKIDGKFIESVIFGTFWQDDKAKPIQNFVNASLDLLSGMGVRDDKGNMLVEIQQRDPKALTPLAPA